MSDGEYDFGASTTGSSSSSSSSSSSRSRSREDVYIKGEFGTTRVDKDESCDMCGKRGKTVLHIEWDKITHWRVCCNDHVERHREELIDLCVEKHGADPNRVEELIEEKKF